MESDSTLHNGSPEHESEVGRDCYPTYTAAEAFIHVFTGLVNQCDVEVMIRAQKQMLQRFEKTNEMLLNCNALSQSRLKNAHENFKHHVKLLNELKKDLDYIFRKIRIIKQKLNQHYPTSFSQAQRFMAEYVDNADCLDTASVVANISGKVAMTNMSSSDRTEGTTFDVNKSLKKGSKASRTVEYVQIEETIENGKPIENDLIKRVCSIETTNPNDSSDCTSEDTG